MKLAVSSLKLERARSEDRFSSNTCENNTGGRSGVSLLTSLANLASR